jgi:hypothetical protein
LKYETESSKRKYRSHTRCNMCVISPLFELHELDSNFIFGVSNYANQALEMGTLFDTFTGRNQLTAARGDCAFATSQ